MTVHGLSELWMRPGFAFSQEVTVCDCKSQNAAGCINSQDGMRLSADQYYLLVWQLWLQLIIIFKFYSMLILLAPVVDWLFPWT